MTPQMSSNHQGCDFCWSLLGLLDDLQLRFKLLRTYETNAWFHGLESLFAGIVFLSNRLILFSYYMLDSHPQFVFRLLQNIPGRCLIQWSLDRQSHW